MKIFIALLLVAQTSFATTKTQPSPGQPSKKFCEVRATFLDLKAARVKGVRGKEQNSTTQVHWNLDIIEVSDESLCPKEKNISLRIRGADFSGPANNPKTNYQVGVSEPHRGDSIRAKIQFISGRDTFTNRNYKEWTLVEVLND